MRSTRVVLQEAWKQPGVKTHGGLATRLRQMFTSGNYSVKNMFRMRDNTYPRDREAPSVPTGPAEVLAGLPYHKRDVRRQERHVAVFENGATVGRIGAGGDETVAEKLAAESDLPPTPGAINQFALVMDKSKRQSYWQRLHTIATPEQMVGLEKQEKSQDIL